MDNTPITTIPDVEFEVTEREIEAMLAVLEEDCESCPRRIESIMERLRVEEVVKESTDFVSDSIGPGLKGLTDGISGLFRKDKN